MHSLTGPQLAAAGAGTFALLEARHAGQADMLLLSAALAAQGGATVLDGGSQFNAYRVTRAVRLRTADIRPQLDTLRVARAFNCYQMLTLCQLAPRNGKPCLALDLLENFEGDDVELSERMRLLRICVQQLQQINRQGMVVVSLALPKTEIEEWQQLANVVRRAATHTLEEGFMGKTVPTINEVIRETEAILGRFARVLPPEERAALRDLFARAKKHIAAISEANHLLPFETVQQAMLLEQEREITLLKAEVAEIKRRLDDH
jgi:hypothetical protein